MVSADVKIHLRRGVGDQLLADCTADFVLKDHAHQGTEPQELLVGFPVTGLNAKIVTVDNFSVQIDGVKPAMVYRQSIAIAQQRRSILKDTAIIGRLAEKYQVKPGQWGVRFSNEVVYPSAYIWSQKFATGEITRVRVTYTATLRPQSLRYSKSYESLPTDGDVIPFSDVWVEKWDEPYYFFDYILVSGATWDGPIGQETIKVSADPELRLPLKSILGVMRNPVGFRQGYSVRSAGVSDIEPNEANYDEDGTPRWDIGGEPNYDLLFAIPVSALGMAKADK